MKQFPDREFYDLRSVVGNDWAIFYFLLGGREVGKSYSVTNMYVNQWKKYGRPFYWLRLTETSAKKLLTNKAEKLVDPDLRRKYDLDLKVKGDGVYDHGKLMARVLALNTFYNDKGSGLFDLEFLNQPNAYYNICLDEMNREANEKRSFDIVYAFANQIENLVRSTKAQIRVICIGNTLEEASDIMCCFNFLPQEFGRFYLVKNKKKLIAMINEIKAVNKAQLTGELRTKTMAEINAKYKDVDFGKRAVVEYMPLNDKYVARRKGTIADILSGDSSTFTNEIKVDTSLIWGQRLHKPNFVIKYGKEQSKWFTMWDCGVIATYNNEKCPVIPMRPYIGEVFIADQRDAIIERFDVRALYFKNLMTMKKFQKELELLKPRKNG